MDVETYEGHEIKLYDGWFTAEVNSQSIRDRTLAGLKKKLAKLKKPLDVLEISHYNINKPERTSVTIDSTMHRFRDAITGRLLGQYTILLPYSPELEAKLTKLFDQDRALQKEWDKLTDYQHRLRA